MIHDHYHSFPQFHNSHLYLTPNLPLCEYLASYQHYQQVRGALAFSYNELLPIDASSSNQVCSTFGLHPNIPHIQHLYDTNDLLFVANMGVLQVPVTENDWMEKTKIPLFAHNLMVSMIH